MANILEVILKGDAKHLNSSLGKASRNLKSFGKRVSSLGSSLQTRLALPLVAAGGASIKMAADFDKSMTQIKTLVGVAGDTVDSMSVSVKRLATEAGISSREAAEALFFITSAGLRGAEAMAVLEQSTKAAAVGLGETKVIADLATSALNAYGVENLSASQATDVLTGAVREGKLSADTLAQSMGTVLPVASQLGVEFSEVGATFAAMSRTGTDAAMAATQIRGVLFALLKPTKQANDTLEQFGLSAAGLRQQIKEEGLLSTLKTLTETFGDNEEAQGKVFANVRALSGVLDLMGKNLGSTEQIFKSMNNTMGITDEAFGKFKESASGQLTIGLKKLGNQFTDLGGILMESLLPVITDVLSFASKLFTAFKNLDPITQQLTIGFAAFAAVLPTILTVGGALLTLLGSLSLPIVAVGAAIAGLIIYFDEIANAFILFKNAVKFNVLAVLIKIDEYIQKYLIRPLKAAGRFLNEFIEEGFSGDFGGIMDDFFAEGEEISKKAGKQIAENFVDQWKQNSEERFEGTIKKLVSKVKDKFSGILSGSGIRVPKIPMPEVETPKTQDLGSIFSVQGNPFGDATKGVEEFAKKSTTSLAVANQAILASSENIRMLDEERMQALQDKANAVGGAVAGAFANMGSNMLSSLGLADDGFEGFVKNLGGTVIDLIAQMMAASIAQSIAGATASGTATGPAAIFTTPAFIATAIGGVLSAFAAIPKFANGGIVSAPTLGLMGEYAGAKSNPEVIAPLDKLKGMIGQRETAVNVTGGFRLEGQDLVMALQRADRNRSRLL